jgi:HAD superfamily phosphoserine phosphatase-like hydrolase
MTSAAPPVPPVVVSDMDGTLATVDTWRGVMAWTLEHRPSPAARRFVRVRLHKVALAKLGVLNKEAFRARWQEDQAAHLAGLTPAELDGLGEWVVEHTLWPARRQVAVDAVMQAAADARAAHPGARLVLASGAYQPIADALARRIGADVTLATPFELRDGAATGRMLRPTQTGESKAAAVLEAARGGEVLVAFGDTLADVPLLRLATRAVAVAPDAKLRREAVARGWEILEA